MRVASKNYYDSNKFLINKNRILRKIEVQKGYVPKLSTLLKYKIEGTPNPTKLQESVDKLENMAVKRLGKTTFDELKKMEAARIGKESATGAEPADMSGLTETQRAERIKNIVVTQKEMHEGFRKLAENDQINTKTAEKYITKFDQILTWLDPKADAMTNVVPLLQNPESVKKKIIAGTKRA